MDIELEKPKGSSFGVRHLQFFLIFIALSIGYAAVRVNLSVAIIGMTDKNQTNPSFETFEWDTKTKQTLLGSVIWGYVAGQIPGGLCARRFGSRHLLAFAVYSTSILTLLTPIVTTLWNWEALLVLRILLGFCQGAFLPSIAVFESKWTPRAELARATLFMLSGIVFGTFTTMALSGIISVELGWPFIFYVPGIFGLIWVFFWYILSADTPAHHSRISESEKKFIQDSLRQSNDSHERNIPIPWLEILTSIPFYASAIAYCGNVWIFVLLMTESPIYLNGMFDITLDKNGFLSSISYLSRFIFEYILIGMEYMIMKKKLLSLTKCRKFFTIMGFIIPAICIAILPFISKQYMYLSILVLLIANSTNAATTIGSNIAPLDMSPNHSGIVVGFTNTISGTFSIFAPILVGLIVTNEKNQEQWQIIFISTSVFLVISCLIFLFFGSNEVQKWDYIKNDSHFKIDKKISFKINTKRDAK